VTVAQRLRIKSSKQKKEDAVEKEVAEKANKEATAKKLK
jgi:hypothetical protein